MLTQLRIPAPQQRQQLVPDAVAGKGQVPIRRVLTPTLPQSLQISLHLSPCRCQKWAQNAALGKLDHRVDAAEPFGPGSAQELGQHCLGLVVAGVCGGHGLHLARGHQLPEPAVTQPSRRFLYGFALSLRLGSGIDPRLVKGNAQFCGQFANEGQISVGLRATQAMVQMCGAQH